MKQERFKNYSGRKSSYEANILKWENTLSPIGCTAYLHFEFSAVKQFKDHS